MVTAPDLKAVGLADPDRALRILVSLAGQGVTDDDVETLLPTLLDALKKSPDPDRALNNFSRWTDSVHSRYTHLQYLLRHPAAVDIFFNVCGVSQLFSDILIRNPEYFEILANPGVRRGAKSAGALYRELSAFVDGIQRTELKLEAMRRFKQREFLRIGTRDILELADMPTTAREFSNLADACVQKCLEIAISALHTPDSHSAIRNPQSEVAPPPFIVVAMGKHGGRELNYSSDIDLLFVTADPVRNTEDQVPSALDSSHKLAEIVIQYLTKNLQNGHLFRVDMRLRPEGRFGALVRTLSSYAAYYESWAEPWERQALIKARVVAGDSALAEAWQEMITPYVYRGSVTSDFVESIRRNKERIEQKAVLDSASETNVKVGSGGIRDIEFTAQLLQLQLGGRYPHVRTPNTLDALGRLRQIGAISEIEAGEMADDYRFLRTVEHRLQILYELQTQSLPKDPAERRLLARRLGFADAQAFDAEYGRRTQRVRRHCERLFYGSVRRVDTSDRWSELFSGTARSDAAHGVPTSVVQALDAEGFREPEQAFFVLRGLAFGSDYGETTPETRDSFLALIGRLVAACTRTGDPNSALRGIESLALSAPNPAAFYQSLAEGDGLLDRLVRLSAGSLSLAQLLSRHPEWMDMLVSEEIIDPRLKRAEECRAELEERTRFARTDEQFFDLTALYVQRERLRIGARDLWGELGPVGAMRELTALAEAVVVSMLKHSIAQSAAAHPEQQPVLNSIAIIGLGKLGGRELGYGSDWDITVAYEKPADSAGLGFAAVEEAVSRMLNAAPALSARGAPVETDLRLRPEGRVGALAFTPSEYEEYYRTTALAWERQVLTKARPVAGDGETGRSFMEMRDRAIYGGPIPDSTEDEIRAMKRRIEQERLHTGERFTNIKLGWGGISDIEFLVQLLQLKTGGRQPSVRVSETIRALHVLAASGALAAPDAVRLAETYGFYNGLRNRISLTGGLSADLLPADDYRLRALAIGLGAADTDTEAAEVVFRRQFDERMQETRALFDRLFYGNAANRT